MFDIAAVWVRSERGTLNGFAAELEVVGPQLIQLAPPFSFPNRGSLCVD
jgi:hypothetical protein